MIRGLLLLATLGVSTAQASEPIQTILVVQDSEKAPVAEDLYDHSGVELYMVDLARKRQLDAQMTQLLEHQFAFDAKAMRPEMMDDPAFKEQIQAGFSEFAKTDQFTQLQAEYRRALEPYSKLAMLQVEKVPAIIINERWTIYGESSLAAAVTTYRNGGYGE